MSHDPDVDDPTQAPDGPPVEARRISAVRTTAAPIRCVWCGRALLLGGALLCEDCRKPQEEL